MESKQYMAILVSPTAGKVHEQLANEMWNAGYELVTVSGAFMYFKKRDL